MTNTIIKNNIQFEIEKHNITFTLIHGHHKKVNTGVITYACNLILSKIDIIEQSQKIEKITIYVDIYKNKVATFITEINGTQYTICDIEYDKKNKKTYPIKLYYINNLHDIYCQKIYTKI